MLWGIRPIEQTATYGLAVEGLRRQIHLGLILPGERLLPERRLAEEINVSRMTLRDALRVLETEGYIRIKRGTTGGAFVIGESELRTLARKMLARDPTAAHRSLEFRLICDTKVARLASQRRTPSHLKFLRDAIDQMDQAKTPGELRRAETMFHMTLAEASGNLFFVRALEDAMTAVFMPLADDVMTYGPLAADLRMHVLRAVETRDEEAAEIAASAILVDEQSRLRMGAAVSRISA
jgi:GntR family transcriptional regulator, transcriptional repressor for pyruvate dehydrogenase complex